MSAGDIDGDGKADVITGGTAPARGPHVKVFDGTGAVLQSFLAYDPSFAGGVTVSSVDVTGDGKADIITSSQVNGVQPPKAFDGTTLAEIPVSFNGLPASPRTPPPPDRNFDDERDQPNLDQSDLVY